MFTTFGWGGALAVVAVVAAVAIEVVRDTERTALARGDGV